jgi:Mrp family chromosome partitioning ATPase
VKTQASGLSEAEIKLRALEREAKAQRDLLESYLARYRDASARHDMGAVPAQATIVSRAHASILPSFPKRGPISLLVAVATALLALAYVLARELIGAPAGPRIARGAGGRADRRSGPPTLRAPREPAIETATTQRAQAAMAPLPRVERTPMRPVTETSPAEQVERPLAASTKAQAAPSVLEPAKPNAPVGAQSAAGFLERLRRGLAPSAAEPQTAATPPAEGWFRRMRGAQPAHEGTAKGAGATSPTAGAIPALRTNDLRHYLNQRLSASAEAANDSARNGKTPVQKTDSDKVGPVLKSLDAVLNHILASGQGSAPRALLVAGASAKVDATAEAISIARSLAKREQVVLVDLTRGPAAVSGPLGLPRAPGLTDLAAGRSSFEDVVRVDGDTSLQVIAAGNPKLAGNGDENGRFTPVFEALTQTYESVVLHADREAVRKLTPALKFELPIVVAILPAGAGASSTSIDLSEFSALGCPVLVYEQSGKEPRSRLFGRVAAI